MIRKETRLRLRPFAAQDLYPRKGETVSQGVIEAEHTLLFAELSGFDALADKLSSKGAEGVDDFTRIVNGFFETFIKTSEEYGGVVVAFSLHSALVKFKGVSTETRLSALTCSKQILERLKKTQAFQDSKDKAKTQIRMALSSGRIKDFRLGNETRLCRLFLGEPVDFVLRTAKAQGPMSVFVERSFSNDLNESVELKNLEMGLELVDVAKPSPPSERPELPEDVGKGLELFMPQWLLERLSTMPEEKRLPGDYRYGTIMCVKFSNLDTEFKSFNEFVSRTIRIIAKFGGTVERFEPSNEGAIITGIFGIPMASEDDEKRAALAAKELVSSTSVVHQKIGISSGFIFSSVIGGATRKTFTVAGRKVEAAFEAMNKAGTNEIIVTKQVREQVQSMFNSAKVRTEGGEDTCELFLLGERRIDVDWLKPPDTRMVGREKELNLLFDVLGRVIQTKSGLSVTVSADEGMGKTRLAQEFAERARKAAFTVAGGRAVSSGKAVPFFPWIDLFRVLLAEGKNKLELPVLERAMRSIERPDWTPLLASLLGLEAEDNDFTRSLSPQERKQKVFAMLLELVSHFAGENPLLVIFDNTQWADSLSRDLISELMDLMPDFPILFLMLARPGSEAYPWQQKEIHSEIPLSPLSAEETNSMLYSRLGTKHIDSALIERIWDASQGNPLYIEEYVKLLESRNALKMEDSKVVLVSDSDFVSLPPNIRRVISARIDLLNDRAKSILGTAAVIGSSFEFELLNRIQEIANNEALERQLSLLAHHGLISRSEKKPHVLWEFKNSLTRDVSYETLPLDHRRIYHEKLAQLLESQTLSPDQILEHYSHTRDEQKIIEYLADSARRSASLYANEEALAKYSEAIKHLSRLKEKKYLYLRFELLLERERIQGLLGRRDEQARDLKSLLLIALSLEDQSLLGTVLSRETSYFYTTGNYARALEKGLKAEELLEKEEKKEKIIHVLITLSRILQSLGRFGEARDRLSKAKTIIAKQNLHNLEAMVAAEFGSFQQQQGNYREALKSLNEALRLFRLANDATAEERIAGQLGVIYKYLGLYEQARSSYETALDLAVKTGDRRREVALLGNLSIISKNMGNYEQALDYGEKGLQIARRIKDLHGEGSLLDTIGNAQRALGHYEKAIRNLSEAIEITGKTGEKPLESKHLSNLANVYSELGDYAKSRDLEERSLAISKEIGAIKSEALSTMKIASFESEKDARKALVAMRNAIKIFNDTGAEALYIESLIELCLILLRTGDAKNFETNIEKALNEARKKGLFMLEASALRVMAERELAARNPSSAFFLSSKAFNLLREKNVSDPAVSFTHARILDALGKTTESAEILTGLYDEIRRKADGIEDENLRKSYLENVRLNREVAQAWNGLGSKKKHSRK